MAFWAKIFGGSRKGDNGPTASEAVQQLRTAEDMLMKKQEFLEKRIEEELAIVKKNGTKNKRLSLQALKRKKRLDKQLEQVDATLTTVESQREVLQNASTNVEVLKIMQVASASLARIHKDMDSDKVADVMEEVREQQETAEELNRILAQPVGGADLDDDELLKELEDLTQEELSQALKDTHLSEDLPTIPSEEPEKSTKSKRGKNAGQEEDLKDLEAWAAV